MFYARVLGLVAVLGLILGPTLVAAGLLLPDERLSEYWPGKQRGQLIDTGLRYFLGSLVLGTLSAVAKAILRWR